MIPLLLALALPSAPEPASLRALCIRADTVLLGSPADPVVPVRFRKVPSGRCPPPGKPLVQDPEDDGRLIVTAVATMAPRLEVPFTVTQSPTTTAEAGTVTI